MCFYQLPELTALIGLSTPFALYASYQAQVQFAGLAALYGDYMSCMTFKAPHYMARQSFLWTWGIFSTPKMAGTVQGVQREEFDIGKWRRVRNIHWWLSTFSTFLAVIVALCAACFTISFKELCTSLYLHGGMTPMIKNAIKWILLPGPSVAAVGIGLYALSELTTVTISLDPGETFFDQLMNIFPSCCSGFLGRMSEKEKVLGTSAHGTDVSPFGKIVRLIAFIVGAAALFVATVAAGQGLSPDYGFLFGGEELRKPNLLQAELWGACGFVFFLVHVPRMMAIAFSTWDDLESLTTKATEEEPLE